MSDQTIYQRLRTHLSYLGLRRAAEVASHLDDAQRDDTSATVFLERLLAEEVARDRAAQARRPLALCPLPRGQAPRGF